MTQLPEAFASKWDDRRDEEELTASLAGAVGATIAEIWHDYDWGTVITLTDGRRVIAEGRWHNDSTAGTSTGLWPPL